MDERPRSSVDRRSCRAILRNSFRQPFPCLRPAWPTARRRMDRRFCKSVGVPSASQPPARITATRSASNHRLVMSWVIMTVVSPTCDAARGNRPDARGLRDQARRRPRPAHRVRACRQRTSHADAAALAAGQSWRNAVAVLLRRSLTQVKQRNPRARHFGCRFPIFSGDAELSGDAHMRNASASGTHSRVAGAALLDLPLDSSPSPRIARCGLVSRFASRAAGLAGPEPPTIRGIRPRDLQGTSTISLTRGPPSKLLPTMRECPSGVPGVITADYHRAFKPNQRPRAPALFVLSLNCRGEGVIHPPKHGTSGKRRAGNHAAHRRLSCLTTRRGAFRARCAIYPRWRRRQLAVEQANSSRLVGPTGCGNSNPAQYRCRALGRHRDRSGSSTGADGAQSRRQATFSSRRAVFPWKTALDNVPLGWRCRRAAHQCARAPV